MLKTNSRQEVEPSKKEAVKGDEVTLDNVTNYTKVPTIDVCQWWKGSNIKMWYVPEYVSMWMFPWELKWHKERTFVIFTAKYLPKYVNIWTHE